MKYIIKQRMISESGEIEYISLDEARAQTKRDAEQGHSPGELEREYRKKAYLAGQAFGKSPSYDQEKNETYGREHKREAQRLAADKEFDNMWGPLNPGNWVRAYRKLHPKDTGNHDPNMKRDVASYGNKITLVNAFGKSDNNNDLAIDKSGVTYSNNY